MITEQEYIELARQEYQQIRKLQEKKNFYEYEKAFDQGWTRLGRTILEKSIKGAQHPLN